MTAPATPLERLEQALAELGALSADGIADRMRALGIKGKRRMPRRCPIALLLVEMMADLAPVAVMVDEDDVVLRGAGLAPNPTSVSEFIKRFDAGVYLDLVVVDGGGTRANS